MYIDFHTHVFPDELAAKTVPLLAESGGVTPALDGTVTALLASMDRAAISRSVTCFIATRPSQYDSILRFADRIRSERIEPFPSVHPDDPQARQRIRAIRAAGFRGIKMHPYYQDFIVDEKRLLDLYEVMAEEGLILVMHTGFDIAFPRRPIASPMRIARVIDRFAGLAFVATHCGAWQQWPEVEEHLLGRPVYMDIAFCLDYLRREDALRLLRGHAPALLLFGSDSPWADQGKVIEQLQALGLEEERLTALLGDNAQRLLGD